MMPRSIRSALAHVIVCLAALITMSNLPAQNATITSPPILILYENEGVGGWMGEMYSLQLQNLLGHFDAAVTRKPISSYVQGDLQKFQTTFYVGAVWNSKPLDAAFLSDLARTTQTVVWTGVNIWQAAWDPATCAYLPAFEQRYGYQVLGFSSDAHPSVIYKKTTLQKDPWDKGLTHVAVTDAHKAKVWAVCVDSAGKLWPYIIQSGKFWLVCDMPMVSTTFANRSLAFADLLHDMLGIPHSENHRAFLRIEDVAPNADVAQLEAIRTKIESLAIPFNVSLIPEYRDWFRVRKGGGPNYLDLTKDGTITPELKKLVQSGGQILQHGTTHQMDEFKNPYSGISGDDYEFYRVTVGANGMLSLLGPVPGDSSSWANARVLEGQNVIKNAGLNPVGWLTPHYLASPADYGVFANLYPFACDRAVFFVEDVAGKTQVLELNSPYIYRDTYGILRMPETIGYIEPDSSSSQPTGQPADLVARAKALLVVRDGWAGCYFHWYLDPTYLDQFIPQIKAMGYQFVPLDATLK